MRHGQYRFIVGFLALPLLVYLVFVISPYLQSFYIALTNWSGYTAQMEFVGLENFRRLIADDLFLRSLQHNLLLLILLPVITLAISLFLAFMLNVGGAGRNGLGRGVFGSRFYKIVYFFPQVLSISIIAVLWQFIYNPNNGALNGVLEKVGLSGLRQSWLGDPRLALWSLLAVMVWCGVGFYVVLFSAGMSAIPQEIYEACALDGAGRANVFFRITLPLLRETVQTGFVYTGIIALDGFALVQVMTVGPGGPDHSTTVVPYYLYTTAFRDSEAGYATSMGLAMLFITLVFAIFAIRISRRERIEF